MANPESSVATLDEQLDGIEANLDRGGSLRDYQAATCAVALGLSADERATARAAAAVAARGEQAPGVVTAAGEAWKAQVKSPCLVVTAAFGDRPAPEVDRLRRFRDTWLRRRAWGRVVISAYARLGPHPAPVVAAHPRLGAAVRGAVRGFARTRPER